MRFSWKILCAALAAWTIVGGASAADKPAISLGVSASLSGGAAQYGIAIRNGFALAAEEINAKGGINGQKIQLVVQDDQGKKEEGMNVFRRLINKDKVLLVFGPTLSDVARSAHPIAQKEQVVAFATSNTADGITAVGNFIFRNSVTEAAVLPETLRVAAANNTIKNVAIMYGNDDVFTKSGYDNFVVALNNMNIPIVATEAFSKNDLDFKAQLTKIKAQNPDAIVLSALIAAGGPIVAQARQLGITVPIIGGNGMNSVKIFEAARGKSDNVWVGSPWSIENLTPENKRFIAAYKAKYNIPPDQFAAQAYDALYVVADAIAKVSITGDLAKDRLALRDALPRVTRVGVTGSFKFAQVKGRDGKTPAGYDAVQKALVMVTKNGRYVIQK